MGDVEVQNIYDREAETSLFTTLLDFTDERRVVAIGDRRGVGKTEVLRKLHHLCEKVHDVPVALVQFNEFADKPEMFSVVDRIRTELQATEAEFPNYDRLHLAWSAQEVESFVAPVGIAGLVKAEGANISGGDVGGIIVHGQAQVNYGVRTWTPALEVQAKNAIVAKFVDDLLTYARDNCVVLLFDTVEHAAEDIKRWLIRNFLKLKVLGPEAEHKLIVVLAGYELHQLLSNQLTDGHLDRITHIDASESIRNWSPEDVSSFLVSKKVPLSDPEQIAAIHAYIGKGGSLVGAVAMAEGWQTEEADS